MLGDKFLLSMIGVTGYSSIEEFVLSAEWGEIAKALKAIEVFVPGLRSVLLLKIKEQLRE